VLAALPHDRYNEFLYVKIMRMQAAAGNPEAARRTLALLESRLAELGRRPRPPGRGSPAAGVLAYFPGNPSGEMPVDGAARVLAQPGCSRVLIHCRAEPGRPWRASS
jgi:hypothetical protein